MLTDFETIKRELAERVTARAAELHEKLDNPLAVANLITLEELARIELRMRALAYAAAERESSADPMAAFRHIAVLRAIAEGRDLP